MKQRPSFSGTLEDALLVGKILLKGDVRSHWGGQVGQLQERLALIEARSDCLAKQLG